MSELTPGRPTDSWTRPLRCAVLEITNRCNLRCAHCASSSGQARAGELTLAEILQLLHDLRTLGCREVTLLGGEALLHPDWFAIASRVGELGMKLLLISNGLLFDEETFAQLRRLRPHLIGISIDGATAESYAARRGRDGWQTCLDVLRRLRDEGHRHVNAITTFTRANLHEFDAFAELFAGTGLTWQVQLANGGGHRFEQELFVTREDYAWLGERMRAVYRGRYPGLHLRPMDDFGYFPLDPTFRFLHQTWRGCRAGQDLIGVRANGDVLGCLSLADPFVEANLRSTPLEQIWRSGRFFDELRHKQGLLEGECRGCPYARECRAGCSAIAYSATGCPGWNTHCLRSLETEAILELSIP